MAITSDASQPDEQFLVPRVEGAWVYRVTGNTAVVYGWPPRLKARSTTGVDTDQRWTAEMAMPLRELTSRGETFGPGAAWSILTLRYNYSRYHGQQAPILTMAPRLSGMHPHRLEEYAPLHLTR